MKVSNVSFYVLIIFAFIGMVSLSTIAHEYSHNLDYTKLALSQSVCLLPMPIIEWNDAIGEYRFTYNQSDTEIKEEIDKYTEIKAYSVSIIIAALFTVVFIISFAKWAFFNMVEDD